MDRRVASWAEWLHTSDECWASMWNDIKSNMESNFQANIGLFSEIFKYVQYNKYFQILTYVLFLYSLQLVKLIMFADDTILIGLITNTDVEQFYRLWVGSVRIIWLLICEKITKLLHHTFLLWIKTNSLKFLGSYLLKQEGITKTILCCDK